MPVAGAVVVPMDRKDEERIADRLREIPSVTVEGIGEKGIAIVLEAESAERLKEISESISQWEEVIEFELVYLNWEEQ
jgi:nitrate reductase NapAB chaperone NapD